VAWCGRDRSTEGERLSCRPSNREKGPIPLSSIIPPPAAGPRKVTEVLPLLYLHGLRQATVSSPARGSSVLQPGCSASVITRSTTAWAGTRHRALHRAHLADRDYVYLWADGVHSTFVSKKSGCAVS